MTRAIIAAINLLLVAACADHHQGSSLPGQGSSQGTGPAIFGCNGIADRGCRLPDAAPCNTPDLRAIDIRELRQGSLICGDFHVTCRAGCIATLDRIPNAADAGTSREHAESAGAGGAMPPIASDAGTRPPGTSSAMSSGSAAAARDAQAPTTDDAGGSGGKSIATGVAAKPICTDHDPDFALLQGFEDADVGLIGTAAKSPWIRLSTSNFAGHISDQWVRSCKHNLSIQSSMASDEIDFLPFKLDAPPSKLNIELWYTPDGFTVWKAFAEFGLGSRNPDGSLHSSLWVSAADHKVSLNTSLLTAPEVVFDDLRYGQFGEAPVHTYVRLELDLCAGTARVFIGADANAPLRATVMLGAIEPFDGFYLRGELSPTYIDDLVISTPNTRVDRSSLCVEPTILTHFRSPGSRCEGLTWDGKHLWMLDNLKHVFELDTAGNVVSQFMTTESAQDLDWDGSALWLGTSTGLVKLDTSGQERGRLNGVYYWAYSGFAWDGKAWWMGDYNSGTIHKHAADGTALLDWQSGIFGHPTGIASDGNSLWIAGSGEGQDNLFRYSFDGQVLFGFDTGRLGINAGAGSFTCLTWDSEAVWYSSDSQFEVYRVQIPKP